MNTELQTKSNISQKQDSPKKNKGAIKEFIAKLSRGLMLPIAMLPIAGLFNGIGAAIANNANGNQAMEIIGNIINLPGSVIFACLPVLFAIAIAITFTKDSGTAGLSAFVGWIVFCAFQSALIQYNYITPGGGMDVNNIQSINFLYYSWDVNGLSSSDGYMMFSSIFTSNVGIKSLSTSVFGGMAVGFSVAWLYNRFKNIQLPAIIGFFSGVRFIPIVTFGFSLVLSLVFCMVWPIIGIGLFYLGSALSSAPAGINSLFFGFIARALVPFGLHHVFNSTFWYTAAGGVWNLSAEAVVFQNGQYIQLVDVQGPAYQTFRWDQIYTKTVGSIQGDMNIWNAMNSIVGQTFNGIILSGSDVGTYTSVTLTFENISQGTAWNGTGQPLGMVTCNPGQYMSGNYAFMMIALPAAALAMVMAAPRENRKISASIVVSAALTSFLTGITEPIEFTFLFLAPWLYWGFHAFMCGLSFMITNAIGVHMGLTFSAGLIDFCLYGVLPDSIGGGANSWWPIIIGLAMAPIYFVVFYYSIKKLDLATPGRGGNAKLFTKADYKKKQEQQESSGLSASRLKAIEITKAYGGIDNIKNVDACITKLRIQVVDINKVNRERLIELGARGTIKPSPQSIYAVFGAEADRIKNEMNQMFEDIKNTPVLKQQYFPNINIVK